MPSTSKSPRMYERTMPISFGCASSWYMQFGVAILTFKSASAGPKCEPSKASIRTGVAGSRNRDAISPTVIALPFAIIYLILL